MKVGSASRVRTRRTLTLVVACLVNVAVLELLRFWHPWPFGAVQGNDFFHEALPVYRALAHGHLEAAVVSSPSYLGSILMRAPLAVPAVLLHASGLSVFFWSALPCVCAGPVLAWWLAGQRPDSRFGATHLPLLLISLNPVTISCLTYGHPEEIMTAALAIAAVVACTQNDRGRLAGVLIGLAVISKPWAIVAVPVCLAAARDRRALLVWFLSASALFWAPLAVAHLASGGANALGAAVNAQVGQFFSYPQLLYWFPSTGWIVQHAHMLIALVPFPVASLWWLGRRHRPAASASVDAMWLLALMLFIRFAFDPWDLAYYPLPFLMAMMATGSGRTSLLAIIATVTSYTINSPHMETFANPVVGAHVFTYAALGALAALLARAFVPWSRVDAVGARVSNASLMRPRFAKQESRP